MVILVVEFHVWDTKLGRFLAEGEQIQRKVG